MTVSINNTQNLNTQIHKSTKNNKYENKIHKKVDLGENPHMGPAQG